MNTQHMNHLYFTPGNVPLSLARQTVITILRILCILLFLFGSIENASAQTTVTIPDANFRHYLKENFPYVLNANEELIIAETATIDTITCYSRHIKDLTGIQYFTSLTALICSGNELTSLPNLSNLSKLKHINFSKNQFTIFPNLFSNTALLEIDCSGNQFSTLPDLSILSELVILKFGKNKFTSFPSFSPSLKSQLVQIECDSNQLTSLPDLSQFQNLATLNVSNNQLMQLPSLTALSQLELLLCEGNLLTELPDLSQNLLLWAINIEKNRFTTFPDISANTKLGFIACGDNQLTSIPDLKNYPDIQYLRVYRNKLTSLPDVSHLDLEQLFVQGNQLTFDDLLRLVPSRDKLLKKAGGANRFYSHKQGAIGTTKSVQLAPGDTYTIDLAVDDTVTTNTYRWYKQVAGVTTLFTTTAANKLVFQSVTTANAGVYFAKVTNPAYPNDTLTSNPVTIDIKSEGPWTPVIGGGENHLIILPATLVSNIQGTPLATGDYVGIFFKDNTGKEVNGGMVKWTGEGLVLNAWGTTATPKNGFGSGEIVYLKVWRTSDQKEIDVVATYNTTSPYTHAGTYAANGLSNITSLTSIAPCVQQVIPLHKGWNLISLNVQPDNLEMKSIFQSTQNVLVKDAAGKILYAPQNGIGNGNWNILEGYKVLVAQEEILTVCGKKIDPQTPINIPYTTYPYFLPYFGSSPASLITALGSIESQVNFVQSNEYPAGSPSIVAYNYLPSHIIDPAIDQIGTLKPGLAYKVSMNSAISNFTYPSVAGMRQFYKTTADLRTHHYSVPVTTTANNALLVLSNEVLGNALVTGDEIGVYTSEGTLAGAGQYNGENLIVTIWETEHMNTNTPFNLKVWKQETQQEMAVTATYQKGNGYYTSNSIHVIQQLTEQPEMQANAQPVSFYPNPARESIQIKTLSEQTGPATIRIYTLMGTKVLEKQTSSLAETTLSVSELAPGQYLCIIQTEAKEFRSKLVIIK